MSEAFRDIGPAAPSRGKVHQLAREVLALAQIALDASAQGPRCDVRRAEGKLREIRALLGGEA